MGREEGRNLFQFFLVITVIVNYIVSVVIDNELLSTHMMFVFVGSWENALHF